MSSEDRPTRSLSGVGDHGRGRAPSLLDSQVRYRRTVGQRGGAVRSAVEREISGSPLRSSVPRILRAVVGTAVAVAGVLIVFGELDHQLYRCNSDAPVMVVRFWPPFIPEAIIAAGLMLAGWPRSKPKAGQVVSPRRWIGQTTLSVLAIVLGPVVVLLARQRAVGPCVWGETTELTVWAVGGVAGPVMLAIGVLAAVWPTARGSRRAHRPPRRGD